MTNFFRTRTQSLTRALIELRAGQYRNGALFLDRDGVLNIDKGYVYRWQDFEWIAGARDLIKAFNDAAWPVFVVTNQSGVARGFYEERDVHALHAAMNEDLAKVDAVIDAFFHCPFHKDGVVEAFRVADHPDRKPNPGMLLRAAKDHGIVLENALMFGDNPSDVEAATRAGAQGFLFDGPDLLKFASAVAETL